MALSQFLWKIIPLLAFMLLWACQNKKQQPLSDSSQSMETNLDTFTNIPLTIYKDIDVLKKTLDSLEISTYEVAQFCQKDTSWLRKVQLVQAVSWSFIHYWKEENKDYWGDIHLDRPFFMETVSFIKEAQIKTFMDVGSGNGEKLFAASCLGFEKIYGLEYSDTLYQLSQNYLQEFIEKEEVEITLDDALTIEKSFYQKADLIYMYCPIKDYQTMAQLYWRILQSMKVGTILLEVRAVYYQELKKISQLKVPKVEVPDMEYLAIRKITDKQFEYLKIKDGQKEWIPL